MSNQGAFPSQVNTQPAPAVAGDFCDANPRASVDAGPGGLVAGSAGVVVGRFAWADPVNPNAVNSYGAGKPMGFVHREQGMALITTFLDGLSMLVLQGLGVTLFKGGGFWAKNDGAGAAAIGQKAYADNSNGKVSFGAAGTPTSGGSTSLGAVTVNTANGSAQLAVNAGTCSIAGTTMTCSGTVSGTVLAAGQLIAGGSAGTGYIDPATTIVAQLTGTKGSTGTYQVSVSQTILSTAFTASGGGMTVTGTVTGTLVVGQTISGTGLTAGTKIVALGTGLGGTGTYALDTAPLTEAGVTVTATGGTFTAAGTITGVFNVGDVIQGVGITAGSYITGNAATAPGVLTGVGGAGTYTVSSGDTVGAGTTTTYANTETHWYATSTGAAGELVKISNTPND